MNKLCANKMNSIVILFILSLYSITRAVDSEELVPEAKWSPPQQQWKPPQAEVSPSKERCASKLGTKIKTKYIFNKNLIQFSLKLSQRISRQQVIN